ncbi:MAG: nucleotidyltransferase family protein [Armatimonadetes bacterium]|nr:nucleotidyltransferase family protein [Armatimonadota bacterium]
MEILEHTREELLFPNMNGMETSVALAEEGNPFTGERYMRRETVKWIFEQLNESGIPYAIIGGLAAAQYALPRMTKDLDILVLDEDRPRLHRLFIKYFVLKTADFSSFLFSGVKMDAFAAKLPYERQALQNAIDSTFEGVPVKVIHPRDLILLKLHAAWERKNEQKRYLDLGDITGVLQTFRDQFTADDIRYIAEQLRTRYQTPEELEKWRERIEWLNEELERMEMGHLRYPLD